MKKTLIILILLGSAVLMSAQETTVKGTHSFEIGAGVNVYGVVGMIGGPTRYPGPGAYFEYRYAFAEHFDVGGQLNYKFGNGLTEYFGAENPSKHFSENQVALKALADYNICPSRKACPYLGLGFGIGESFTNKAGYRYNDTYGTICPRFGVRIGHVRIALEVDLAYCAGYFPVPDITSTALNLSYTF